MVLGRFCFYYDRTVSRQEGKREREGGWDLERSASRGSNSGRPKRNSVICHGLEFFIADLFEMSS